MEKNTILLAKFAHISSIRLQKKRTVDVSIVRRFQPLLDCHNDLKMDGKPGLHLQINRQNFQELFLLISGAIAKKAAQGSHQVPPQGEIDEFLRHFHSIACSPGFPFYGNRIKDYLSSNRKRIDQDAASLFASSGRNEAVEFLKKFKRELVSLLEQSATFADLDGGQVFHLQFHTVFSLSLLVQDYLTRFKYSEDMGSMRLSHICD